MEYSFKEVEVVKIQLLQNQQRILRWIDTVVVVQFNLLICCTRSWLPQVVQDFCEKHIMHIKNTIKIVVTIQCSFNFIRLWQMVCLGTSYKAIYTTTGNVTQAITVNSIMKLFKYFVDFSVCYCEVFYTKNLVYAVLVHLEFRFIQKGTLRKKINFL